MHIANLVVLFAAFFSCVYADATARKIVNGFDTNIETFPFMASLRKNGSHSCGAAIISATAVLTASHCLMNLKDDSPEHYLPTIVVGESLKNIAEDHHIYFVNELIRHPHFDETTTANDIAVIKIHGRFELSETVQICPLSSRYDDHATILGWGLTDNDEDTATFLKVADVPVLDINECRNAYKEINLEHQIFDYCICASNSSARIDTCSGDSGGPLIIDSTLVGVVSWGLKCADPNFPGVFLNVTTFIPWILQSIF